ncbi:MAG: recombinase RecT [Vibrio cyclitrophicus]
MSDAQRTVFLEVCKVNNLNPFKKEVYAVPFYDSKKKKYDLQPVTSYTVYLARANESGLLDGWNVELEKDDNGNVTSGKITIHRKDRSYPFVWVLDFEEVVMRNYNTKKPT